MYSGSTESAAPSPASDHSGSTSRSSHNSVSLSAIQLFSPLLIPLPLFLQRCSFFLFILFDFSFLFLIHFMLLFYYFFLYFYISFLFLPWLFRHRFIRFIIIFIISSSPPPPPSPPSPPTHPNISLSFFFVSGPCHQFFVFFFCHSNTFSQDKRRKTKTLQSTTDYFFIA